MGLAVLWWVLVMASLYTYAGYPLLLLVLVKLRPRAVEHDNTTPTVSLIIAAHNEEACIRDKMENSLSLDYPIDKLEIFVASDASTDRTNEIVREYADRGARLNAIEERRGKTYAQNETVKLTTGEILVFSDANSMYEPDVIRKLVRNFADPHVGYVSGELRYRKARSAIGAGEGLYWRYETYIKRWESRTGNITSGNGAIYALPRKHFFPLQPHQSADISLPLAQIQRGLRTIHEAEAVAYEDTALTASDEYGRKHRSVAQTLGALSENLGVLNPFRYGLTAVKLFSHRHLRYLVPIFIILIFALNFLLLSSRFFQVVMGLQVLFYLLALVGVWVQGRGGRILPFYVPYYFCVVNLAALKGAVRFLRGEKVQVWEKAATTRIPSSKEQA